MMAHSNFTDYSDTKLFGVPPKLHFDKLNEKASGSDLYDHIRVLKTKLREHKEANEEQRRRREQDIAEVVQRLDERIKTQGKEYQEKDKVLQQELREIGERIDREGKDGEGRLTRLESSLRECQKSIQGKEFENLCSNLMDRMRDQFNDCWHKFSEQHKRCNSSHGNIDTIMAHDIPGLRNEVSELKKHMDGANADLRREFEHGVSKMDSRIRNHMDDLKKESDGVLRHSREATDFCTKAIEGLDENRKKAEAEIISMISTMLKRQGNTESSV